MSQNHNYYHLSLCMQKKLHIQTNPDYNKKIFYPPLFSTENQRFNSLSSNRNHPYEKIQDNNSSKNYSQSQFITYLSDSSQDFSKKNQPSIKNSQLRNTNNLSNIHIPKTMTQQFFSFFKQENDRSIIQHSICSQMLRQLNDSFQGEKYQKPYQSYYDFKKQNLKHLDISGQEQCKEKLNKTQMFMSAFRPKEKNERKNKMIKYKFREQNYQEDTLQNLTDLINNLNKSSINKQQNCKQKEKQQKQQNQQNQQKQEEKIMEKKQEKQQSNISIHIIPNKLQRNQNISQSLLQKVGQLQQMKQRKGQIKNQQQEQNYDLQIKQVDKQQLEANDYKVESKQQIKTIISIYREEIKIQQKQQQICVYKENIQYSYLSDNLESNIQDFSYIRQKQQLFSSKISKIKKIENQEEEEVQKVQQRQDDSQGEQQRDQPKGEHAQEQQKQHKLNKRQQNIHESQEQNASQSVYQQSQSEQQQQKQNKNIQLNEEKKQIKIKREQDQNQEQEQEQDKDQEQKQDQGSKISQKKQKRQQNRMEQRQEQSEEQWQSDRDSVQEDESQQQQVEVVREQSRQLQHQHQQSDGQRQEEEEEQEDQEEREEGQEGQEGQEREEEQDQEQHEPSVQQQQSEYLQQQTRPSIIIPPSAVLAQRISQQKSKYTGSYLYGQLSEQSITQYRRIMSQYNPSNYFHVGPRYQILSLIRDLANETRRTQIQYSPEQCRQKFDHNKQRIINKQVVTNDKWDKCYEEMIGSLGTETRLYFNQAKCGEILSIVSEYYGSNYFHVGPRRQMFYFVEEAIKLVERIRGEINRRKIDYERVNGSGNNDGNGGNRSNNSNNNPNSNDHNNNNSNNNGNQSNNNRQGSSNLANNNQSILRTLSNLNTALRNPNSNTRLNMRAPLRRQDIQSSESSQDELTTIRSQLPDYVTPDTSILSIKKSTSVSNTAEQSLISSASSQIIKTTPIIKNTPIKCYSKDQTINYRIGQYLLCKLNSTFVAKLQSTISQYNSSNYFHVGPRYQILGFMESLIQQIKQLNSKTDLPNIKPENNENLIVKRIKIGEEARKYLSNTKMQQILGTCRQYNGSNYFHVGPRYSLFGDVKKIISISQIIQ